MMPNVHYLAFLMRFARNLPCTTAVLCQLPSTLICLRDLPFSPPSIHIPAPGSPILLGTLTLGPVATLIGSTNLIIVPCRKGLKTTDMLAKQTIIFPVAALGEQDCVPFLFSCSRRILAVAQARRTGRTLPTDTLQVTTQAAVPSKEGQEASAARCTAHLQGNKATPSYRFLNLVTPHAGAPASSSALWLLVVQLC